MSIISVDNLTFGYDGASENVFENVSFKIDTDWRLGFIGRNGRGKTTFLRLLLGEHQYSGKITADVEFNYFPYRAPNEDEAAIAVAESICGREDWEIIREVSYLNMNIESLYKPFSILSGGERTKLMIAALFLKENGFMLLDEPTNHLDVHAKNALRDYLSKKKGFILVSHDRRLLDGCADHILSINRDGIEVVKGNFSSWKEEFDLKNRAELKKNEELKKDIKRLKASAAETEKWSHKTEKSKNVGRGATGVNKIDKGYVGHKSAKLMKRAKNIASRQLKAAEEKGTLLKNVEYSGELKLSPLSFPKSTLVELNNVSIFYDGREVCGGIGFSVERGERVCLRGENGAGKSSVLKLIVGEDIEYSGEALRSETLKISYVRQDSSGLSGTLKEYAGSLGVDETLFMTILRKLDFPREVFRYDISSYSEGQKKKVMLAGSLSERAHLYVWDEPLNYIDIISRIQIEELILKFTPTLLFVEHDEEFCSNIADKFVEI